MANQNSSWIIYDGKLKPAKEPVAYAASRGLMYGDGIFETLRVYGGKTLLFEKHMERLKAGSQMLGMDSKHLPREKSLKVQIHRLLQENTLLNRDAIVRLQCWRGGERGYRPRTRAEIHYTVTASRCPDYEGTYPALATVATRRIPSESLPSTGKFTNGINYILAAQEAAAQKADDALMQTVDGRVSETTIANIFWIEEGQIFTPSTECDLIRGITRQVVLDIIDRHPAYRCREGSYAVEKLYQADAVALCNSVREITPVRRIDNHTFDTNHPVFNELKQLYSDYRDQKLKLLPGSD
ncbi:branched chain amino acid aminotransferase apoenzyme [Fodinibius roseus]|uniref:Branched chain amino acid aminotransferase apoenzyme n=1 Tax=Fodinibius roseus TaxID=1194090 RepID=A0A1M4TLH1_9BACT|nr:aminotransferase class IV [Fodinibius roseus]SHE45311.1 branched chain amino acid aminotransferase apoenzyme [Fodinibius roseus]